jgi:hypothetical protein
MKLTILIFCLSFFLISCYDLLGEIYEKEYEYVRKSQIGIGEISLFTEKDNLIEYLGKPDSVDQGFYYYHKINMYLAMDSVIWEINSKNPNHSTPDGISIGNSKEKVLEIYGETETVAHIDNNGETLNYLNDHFFQPTPMFLYFSIRNDTVNEISLWWHYE